MYAQPNTKTMYPIRSWTANQRTWIYRSDGSLLYKSPRFKGKPHFTILDHATSLLEAETVVTMRLNNGYSCCKNHPTCGCIFPAKIETIDYKLPLETH